MDSSATRSCARFRPSRSATSDSSRVWASEQVRKSQPPRSGTRTRKATRVSLFSCSTDFRRVCECAISLRSRTSSRSTVCCTLVAGKPLPCGLRSSDFFSVSACELQSGCQNREREEGSKSRSVDAECARNCARLSPAQALFVLRPQRTGASAGTLSAHRSLVSARPPPPRSARAQKRRQPGRLLRRRATRRSPSSSTWFDKKRTDIVNC